MAVGLTTGKVDLIRLEAGKQTQHKNKNILSTGPSVTLSVRNSRSCNALAFSTADPNYLAVGLDKVQGDSSLIICDISTLTSSLSLPITAPTTATPHPSRPQPQIPRLDNQAKVDPRVLQQHAPTEVVSSLAFLPSSAHLLLAGISHRWLRLFDLRSPSTAAINVASKVQGIAADPFDPHRVACFGDGIVSVWDARKLHQPLLLFSERDAIADGARLRPGSIYANIEFSSTRRSCLATLEKESSYVRFWDLTEVRTPPTDGSMAGGGSSDGDTKSIRDSTRASRRSWAANLPWPAGDKQQFSPKERDTFEPSSQSSFTVADTRRTKYFPRSLASFALVPNPNMSPSLTSKVMVVNKDGDLELYAQYDTPKQPIWSSRGDLAICAGVGLKIIGGSQDTTLADAFSLESVSQSRSRFIYDDRDIASRSSPVSARDHSIARGRAGQPSVCRHVGAIQAVAKRQGKEEMGKKAVVHTAVHIGAPDNMPGFDLAVDIKVKGVDEELLKAGHEFFPYSRALPWSRS